MSFGGVLGQEAVAEVLGRAVTENRLSHAYLFTGPRGMGKAAMAKVLAKAVNCRKRGEGWRPCDDCSSCRQVDAGSHPDVRWLEPDGATIKIAQVRELTREAAMRPLAGGCRVFIIRQADRMSAEAANSLLKVLEDPPGRSMFILLTALPDALLPTIVSRCQGVPFRPVARDTLAIHLVNEFGLEPDRAKLVATLSRGNPGRAAEMASSTEFGEAVRLAGEAVGRLWGSKGPSGVLAGFEVAQALEAWKSSEYEILDFLAWIFRDCLVRAVGAGVEDAPESGIVVPVNLCAGPAALFQALGYIEEARRQLKANANRRLVFEVLSHKLRALGG